MEFICPICRRLGNTLLPLVTDSMLLPAPSSSPNTTSQVEEFDSWLRSIQQILRNSQTETPSLLSSADNNTSHPVFTALESSLDAFVTKLYTVLHRFGHERVSPDERASPLLWSSLSVTLASSEISKREESLLPFDPKLSKLFKALWRAGQAHRKRSSTQSLNSGVDTPSPIRLKQLELLRKLLAGESSASKLNPLLTTNLFGILVNLVQIWPKQLTRQDLSYLLRLVFMAVIAQTIVSVILTSSPKTVSDTDKNNWRNGFPRANLIEQVSSLETLFMFVDGCTNGSINLDTMNAFPASAMPSSPSQGTPFSPSQLVVLMEKLTLPFLRRTALFYTCCIELFEMNDPHSKPQNWTDLENIPSLNPTNSETVLESDYPSLLKLLQLEHPQHILKKLSSTQRWILRSWLRDFCSQYQNLQSLSTNSETDSFRATVLRRKYFPLVAPAEPVELIRLPNLYQDFFSKFVSANCDLCGTFTSQTAVCLICGAVLCGDRCCPDHLSSLTFNNVVIESSCGDVGLFLITNSTVVLLLRGPRYCFWGSPYLDEHGEEDIELRRGKPLYLSQFRYNQLKKLWLTHGMDHDSHVLANTQREQDDDEEDDDDDD
eukprot:TRINITY_DN1266_c0_g1_i2.p1 TRINITY_DN1266_c0_g1~~TRINITY_DN1266_c0_g1_i2.p1  ORF type:complete len:603 (-),score=89.84 TRINITY_DN1266_c0_g1_i2:142-1950(-)